jgi:cold-inducible RNA-binding protein
MKLYIGNIPFDAREEELRDLFSGFGTLGTAIVIVDPRKGRSRGFGFVEFDDPEHGRAAIAGVNGTQFGGRKLVVNEARSRDGGSSGYRGGRGGYGGGRGSDRSAHGSEGGNLR